MNSKELIEQLAKLENITGKDLLFAFNLGYNEGKLEVLEKQLGDKK